MAEIKGKYPCDSCGEMAALKQIKNSTNLYLHCSTCGCDRRTGAGIQAKWLAAVNGENAPENSGNIPDSETGAAPQTARGSQEWTPTPETHRKTVESDPDNIPEKSRSGAGRKILTGLVFLLSAAGFIYKATRG